MADISAGINLEFSRAFYAFGLMIAGIIGDRSRKYGAIICFAALFFPFAMIALSGTIGISIVLWILGYFFSDSLLYFAWFYSRISLEERIVFCMWRDSA